MMSRLYFLCYIIIYSIFHYPLFFIFRKIFDVRDNIDALFLFLLQIDFGTFHKHIDDFCFSFLHKDFDTTRQPRRFFINFKNDD